MRDLVIADNQAITRFGIKYIAEQIKEIQNIYFVTSKNELIEHLEKLPESMVLLDYSLLDFGSINEINILKNRFSSSDWIFFSEELSDYILTQLVYNENKFSIVLKTDTEEEIKMAFAHAYVGEKYTCQRIASHLLNSNRKKHIPEKTLTNTEKEILKEIASGKSTKEIAYERNSSIHTVITHRKNIFRKLEVNTIHEATCYAIKAGIADITEYFI